MIKKVMPFDSKKTEAALLRAAKKAREIAMQTGTPIVVNRDGKVVKLDPRDLSEWRGGECLTKPPVK
jgi:hypothetical protein